MQAVGLLGALRTGDAKVDLILALCLPFIIQSLFSSFKRLENYLKSCHWFSHRPKMHSRSVIYRSTRGMYGGTSNLDEDSQNRVLQKAIKLYLHSEVKIQLSAADTNLTALDGKGALSSHNTYYNDYDDDEADDSKRTVVGILSTYKLVQSPPVNDWHKIGCFGKESSVVELQISHSEEQDGSEKSPLKSSTLAFNFRSDSGGAIDAFLDTAYNWYLGELKELEDHSRYLYDLKPGSSPAMSRRDDDDDGSPGDGQGSGHVYKRYPLSDEKTFDSLFFQQKASLLSLIGNFQSRQGKYAIKGYPHKLGLLLFGPPGSGKTSLIKALAQHTGRSVINVPLSRIKTNAELMAIFYDNTLRVEGQYVPVKLRFKDVIFVIEDVDAASKIVKRRDGKKTGSTVQTDLVEVTGNKPLWHMLLESRDHNCKSLVKELMEKSDRLKREALDPKVVQLAAERMMTFPAMSLIGEAGDNPLMKKVGEDALRGARELMNQYDTIDRFLGIHAATVQSLLDSGATVDSSLEDSLLGLTPPSWEVPPPLFPVDSRERQVSFSKFESDGGHVHFEDETMVKGEYDWTTSGGTKAGGKSFGPTLPSSWKVVDELNLQGVLNVLDGVVDSPGRIVIMTTNHPEHLDPALIRPGRIDKKLLLGYMGASDLVEMLEHYFQVFLAAEQRERIERMVDGFPLDTRSRLCLTPAQVEQMAAEHDDIEDMIVALERKGSSLVPRSKFGASYQSGLLYDS